MPLYVFECGDGHHTEQSHTIADRPKSIRCTHDCKKMAVPIIVPPNFHPFESYFDDNLCDDGHPNGQWVETAAQRKGLMRELNLEEIGTTDYSRDREKRGRIYSIPGGR